MMHKQKRGGIPPRLTLCDVVCRIDKLLNSERKFMSFNYLFSGDRETHIPKKIFHQTYGSEYTDIYDIEAIDNISLNDIVSIIERLHHIFGHYISYGIFTLSIPSLNENDDDDINDDDDVVDDDDIRKQMPSLSDKVRIGVGSNLIKFMSHHLLIFNQYFSGAGYSTLKIFADKSVNNNVIKIFIDEVCKLSKQNSKEIPEDMRKASFSMVIKDRDGSYDTSSFRYDYKKFNNLKIDTHYNDDFFQINEKIINHINRKKSSGVVILHGVPGTGKTTYLRFLISNCKKDIIYLPPDMTNYLSDPGFIGFMKQQANCVFIVEDAEEILKKRGETRNSGAVSNILNVSDGILADVLHCNFIFTINCEIDEIDGALKRPGRLVAEYKFSEMSYDKTIKLITELYPDVADQLIANVPKNGLTLAKIYNLKETAYLYSPKKNGIGFTANI